MRARGSGESQGSARPMVSFGTAGPVLPQVGDALAPSSHCDGLFFRSTWPSQQERIHSSVVPASGLDLVRAGARSCWLMKADDCLRDFGEPTDFTLVA